LREKLLAHAQQGCRLRFVVGIDLGGTSRDVLEELLRWKICDVFVIHNALENVTFHPKVYLFERAESATLFVGSNNLTDGGLYTNYEASVRHDFVLPHDDKPFDEIVTPLCAFLDPVPDGRTIRQLDRDLIDILAERGELINEREARSKRDVHRLHRDSSIPDNPFKAVAVPLPPNVSVRRKKRQPSTVLDTNDKTAKQLRKTGRLVWEKILSPSDALVKKDGTHPVGALRLTQAKFKEPGGKVIDQTTYFRRLFDAFGWEADGSQHVMQEHTFVPMRVFVKGADHGVIIFEISHNPTREAGQGNFTTVLRWGRGFSPVIQKSGLSGATFSLYEISEPGVPFMIEIR
jgi:hypothetical protein